jgi:membrane-associated protease RseP (regulator of RpoE activity)
MVKIKYLLPLFCFIVITNAAVPDSVNALTEIEEVETFEKDTLELQKKGEEAVLGIVMNNDLTFDVAKRKQWNEQYGALVSWVTSGSAAEKYGIQDGDIITNFNGQKVLYNDHLRKLIKSRAAGDTVAIVIYRDGKFYKTDVVMGAAQEPEKVVTLDREIEYHDFKYRRKEKNRIIYGKTSGGISWEPMWYSPDWTDINNLAAAYGFTSFSKDMELAGENYPGILLHSINFSPVDESHGIQNTAGIYFSFGDGVTKTNKVSGTSFEEKLTLKNNFFGVVFGSSIPFFDKIILSPKVKAGFWNTQLTLSRTSGELTWNEITESFDDPATNTLKMERKYYTLSPTVELVYKVTDSFGIHAGVSYMYGFGRHSGWKTKSENMKSYDIIDSPDTKLDGYIFTVGPWLFFD